MSKISDGFHTGNIVWSNRPINNSNFHLLDGSNLLLSGDYDSFVNWVVTIPKTEKFFCTEQEYNEQVQKTGTCGRSYWNSTYNYIRLPLTTDIVQEEITSYNPTELTELLETYTCCFCYPGINNQNENIYDEYLRRVKVFTYKDVYMDHINGYSYICMKDLKPQFYLSDNVPDMMIFENL